MSTRFFRKLKLLNCLGKSSVMAVYCYEIYSIIFVLNDKVLKCIFISRVEVFCARAARAIITRGMKYIHK
jgi:hypothetical protein